MIIRSLSCKFKPLQPALKQACSHARDMQLQYYRHRKVATCPPASEKLRCGRLFIRKWTGCDHEMTSSRGCERPTHPPPACRRNATSPSCRARRHLSAAACIESYTWTPFALHLFVVFVLRNSWLAKISVHKSFPQ